MLSDRIKNWLDITKTSETWFGKTHWTGPVDGNKAKMDIGGYHIGLQHLVLG